MSTATTIRYVGGPEYGAGAMPTKEYAFYAFPAIRSIGCLAAGLRSAVPGVRVNIENYASEDPSVRIGTTRIGIGPAYEGQRLPAPETVLPAIAACTGTFVFEHRPVAAAAA